MPKWLSSILILIGFIALVALAILPRNVEVTVTTNIKQDETNEMTVNFNGDGHNGAVSIAPTLGGDEEPTADVTEAPEK